MRSLWHSTYRPLHRKTLGPSVENSFCLLGELRGTERASRFAKRFPRIMEDAILSLAQLIRRRRK
jgi:hypothetical protein